jgi:hypothetical protein
LRHDANSSFWAEVAAIFHRIAKGAIAAPAAG